MILKCLLSGIGKYRYGKSRSEPVSGYYNRLILIKIPYFSSDPPHGYYSTVEEANFGHISQKNEN